MTRAILLFGYPGSGKGTQGKILGALPGFHHVSTGDIFRGLTPQHPLYDEVQRHVRAGNLVPDDLVMEMLLGHVERLRPAPDDFVLLDGVPRNLRQVEFLRGRMDVVRILELAISDETLVLERMRKRAQEQGRPDDAAPDVVRHRLDVYRRETEACGGAYPAGILARIRGDQSIFHVHLDIVRALAELPDARFR